MFSLCRLSGKMNIKVLLMKFKSEKLNQINTVKSFQLNHLCFFFAVTSCGYPGSPSHAVVTFTPDNIRPGTVATYECEPGFELLGPSRRLCSSNGTWTPAGIPFCGKSRCFLFFLTSFFYETNSQLLTLYCPITMWCLAMVWLIVVSLLDSKLQHKTPYRVPSLD